MTAFLKSSSALMWLPHSSVPGNCLNLSPVGGVLQMSGDPWPLVLENVTQAAGSFWVFP